jgi:hypothetical protein
MRTFERSDRRCAAVKRPVKLESEYRLLHRKVGTARGVHGGRTWLRSAICWTSSRSIASRRGVLRGWDMKTELWCSHGCRCVVRCAWKGTLQFRVSTFAMLAAFLPMIAFAHSAYAQTNTPGASASSDPCSAPGHHGGADAGDNASRPVPHVPTSCRSSGNGRQSIASVRGPSASAGCNVAGRAITRNKRGSARR